MQYHWLNKQNNKKLVVFFAGWSFDYCPFECINTDGYDVLMFYDYKELDIPQQVQQEIRLYVDKTLITWSMGVFVAYLLKDSLPLFNKKIAVNGTPYPVNNEFGIPERTFNLTLKYAETGLQGKFYENAFSNEKFLQKYLKNPVQRPIANRVAELEALYNFIKNKNFEYDNEFYDIALVSLQDKIIPPKNQLNMWKEKAVTIDCGHFPFYNYNSWDEICNLTLNQ